MRIAGTFRMKMVFEKQKQIRCRRGQWGWLLRLLYYPMKRRTIRGREEGRIGQKAHSAGRFWQYYVKKRSKILHLS